MQDRRQQVQRRIDSDLGRMAKLRAMRKRTVSEVKLGQRKRAAGQRTAYLLTSKGEGNRTRSVYVSADRVAEVERMVNNHRKARAILDRIVELNLALFKIKP